jgi:hypothetical protein
MWKIYSNPDPHEELPSRRSSFKLHGRFSDREDSLEDDLP